MKENYFERIPKLLSQMDAPKEINFTNLQEFHARSVAIISQIEKITSDNRYLIFFFREEFEKLGGPVKSLAKKVDEFGKGILENQKYLEEAENSIRILENINAL